MQIHLIGIQDSPDHSSVHNKGRDLVSVVRIRESAYYRFFLKKIYENFVVIFFVRNIEVSILERCLYQEVRL